MALWECKLDWPNNENEKNKAVIENKRDLCILEIEIESQKYKKTWIIMQLKATYYKKNKYEAGTDEAGRGCLVGPVYAAVVVLDPKKRIVGLNDSKKLKESARNQLREEIEEKAIEWKVIAINQKEIDRINILQASLKAMFLCVQSLKSIPDIVLVDGNKSIPALESKQKCIIKGDGIYQSIAAASILAKTHRDEYMQKIHKAYPQYSWDSNKGYPTEEHRRAIIEFGPCVHHRKSFISKIMEKRLFEFSS